MIHLLDVNVLLALHYTQHVHHSRVFRWNRELKRAGEDELQFATCSITELGFVRVASGPAALSPDVSTACADLIEVKRTLRFVFLSDSLGGSRLPDWVTRSKQTTDGHLLQLASGYGAILATLDSRIPGAQLIPELSDESSRVSEPRLVYGAAA